MSARVGLWLTQRRDVVHHRLHPSADRLKTSQPQQVECCSSQAGQRTSAIAPVSVGVLVELGLTDPVPALNAPAVSHQLQQCFWGGAQACEKQVLHLKRLAVSGAGSGHLQNPAGAHPALEDVQRCLLCPQRPGDVAAICQSQHCQDSYQMSDLGWLVISSLGFVLLRRELAKPRQTM